MESLQEVYQKKRMLKLISTRKSSAQKAKKIIGAKKILFLDFKDNQLDSYPLLKIIKPIERIIFKIKPDTIYTHFEEDLNIDHQVANKAVVTICRPQKSNSVKILQIIPSLIDSEWLSTRILGRLRITCISLHHIK